MKKTIYCKASLERQKKLQIYTRIVDEDGRRYVEKECAYPEGQTHILDILENYRVLNALCRDITVCQCELVGKNVVRFPFLEGETLLERIYRAADDSDFEAKLEDILSAWIGYIRGNEANVVQFEYSPEFTGIFGDIPGLEGVSALKIANLDLNFDNIIYNEKETIIFDYEWVCKYPVPIDFILYRLLELLIAEHRWITSKVSKPRLLKICGVSIDLTVLRGMVDRFYEYINCEPATSVDMAVLGRHFLVPQMKTLESIIQTCIYIDKADGFSEENKETVISRAGEFFMWSKALDSSTRYLRFDPVDNLYCVFHNLSIKVNGVVIDNYGHNGTKVKDDIYFDNLDSQILIELPQKEINQVEISGVIVALGDNIIWNELKKISKLGAELNDLHQRTDELLQERARLIDENTGLNQRCIGLQEEVHRVSLANQALMQSASWKLTKPMRFVSRLLRGVIRSLRSALRSPNILNSSLKYCVDCCDYSNSILVISGWMLSEEERINQLHAVVSCDGHKHSIPITERIRRPDVVDCLGIESAMDSGFKIYLKIEDCSALSVGISYKSKTRSGFIDLGTFKSDSGKRSEKEASVTVIETDTPKVELKHWEMKNTLKRLEYPAQIYNGRIDVVVPVYNGYAYLETLFDSMARTKMPYRLIIINDKSTDERIWPYLRQRFQDNPNVVLVNNEENLGFVRTVNKALGMAENHVAIVNTDVEVPPMWLERLMMPVILNRDVASSTPFTNAGTLCSFPKIGVNNPLFEGLPVETIDQAFQKLKPAYSTLPTGVGFCMGMSSEALKSVGLLDAETFSKGYGEENDWCQRAIQMGFKNVAVENLFVYHKHGGSFSSEEKNRLLEINQKRLVDKHPSYLKDVALFFETDMLKPMRQYAAMRLSFCLDKKAKLVFNHNLGGGATSYIEKRKAEWLVDGYPVVTVRSNPESQDFFLFYEFGGDAFSYTLLELDYLADIFNEFGLDAIYVNELVTYFNIYSVLGKIVDLKNAACARLVYLFHDYYALCPSINLLDDQRQYCGLNQPANCERCLAANQGISMDEVISRQKWTENWGRFLHACDDVVVFSQSSAELVSRIYGDALHVTVRPHRVEHLLPIHKPYKTTSTLNIGLLGVLTYHKGKQIVSRILDMIAESRVSAKIVLIGSVDGDKLDDANFVETGRYSVEMLPRLVFEHDIDLFLIPSIWPETFSYTTEEIIQSNMPVVAFDLGAPAERIRNYDKGRLVSRLDAALALEAVRALGGDVSAPASPYMHARILFVTEFITFSSRYRVEHLREQLIMNGVASDFIEAKDLGQYSLEDYGTLFIYRCSYTTELAQAIEAAREAGLRVLYDIDDYIYDYKSISDLDFLQKDEYKDFEQYSDNLKRCMSLCDGFVTSTNTLKERIAGDFPDKTVCVNRNVASMEMVILSRRAAALVKRDAEKVILGYFSGTKTHDKDFLLIKDVLIGLMEKHENLRLLLGGVVEIDPELKRFEDRIMPHGFMDWRCLPEIIASVDINLMPLEDTVFHACKSENKWMEAALVKVVTVASHNSELAGAINDKETGYLCRTAEDWRSALETLIADGALREQIGAAAYEAVMQTHTTGSDTPGLLEYIVKEQGK